MTGSPESLSILIPSYNEAATLPQALRRLWAVDLPVACEVIVIDDASTDGTLAAVEELRGESPWPLTYRRHERNRGKTASLRTGLGAAEGSLTLVYDADLEYDPADIPTLLAPVLEGHADAVYGSRFLSPSRRVLFFWHALGNRMVTSLANIFANLNLTDMETCFKLVRTDLLRQMRIRSERFGFEPEVTVKLGKMGVRVYEVPIRYAGRSYEEGKKIRWWDALRAVGTIIRAGLFETPSTGPLGVRREIRERLTPYYTELLRRSGLGIPQKVLVIAAGEGGLPIPLLQCRRLLLSDPDPDVLRRLKTRYSHRPNVETAAEPRDGEPFDAVVAMHGLDAFEDPSAAMRMAARALASQGRLVALLPAMTGLMGTLDAAIGRDRRYGREEAVGLIEGSGLEVETIRKVNGIGGVGWWLAGRVARARRLRPLHASLFRLCLPIVKMERFLPTPIGLSWLITARREQ